MLGGDEVYVVVPEPGERRQITIEDAEVRVAWIERAAVEDWCEARPQRSWLAADEVASLAGLSTRAATDRSAARLALKLLVRGDPRFSEVPLEHIVAEPDVHGRPRLVVGGRADGMPSISLSHARGWGAAAVATIGVVGVDVEHERPGMQRVKQRLLALGEQADDPASILRLWVLKEAAVKAWGAGIDLPLSEVRVALDDGAADITMPSEASRWDTSVSLLGSGRWWTTESTAVAVAHFMTSVQEK